jgi:hypothetical protein
MLEPADDFDSWDDESDFEDPFDQCLFPRLCVMPSPHFQSECMTWMEASRYHDAAMNGIEARP